VTGVRGRRLRRWLCRVLCAASASILVAATPALAQGPRAGTWELTAGGAFVGGFDMGNRAAELTPNSGSEAVDLFKEESRINPAAGLQAKIGIYLTPAFALEGGMRYTRPVNETRITDDFEDAADLTAEESIDQYLFEVSAVWHFGTSSSGRTTPFVYGGAGYLRELHEGDALVEEGVEIHAGGGVKWWFGSGRQWGVRADAGISMRDGGADSEDKWRVLPQATGSVFWVF
jgi:hypothetical protein